MNASVAACMKCTIFSKRYVEIQEFFGIEKVELYMNI